MMEILNKIKTQQGNEIHLIGNNYESNSTQKNTILIIGVFHGDEPQGEYLIKEYLKTRYFYSTEQEFKHKCEQDSPVMTAKNNLLFIPCLNPDGMSNKTRTNANGVDLNRNFPTANWGHNEGDNATCDDETTAYFGGKCPSSEVETQFLIDTIEKYLPKLILTLHAPYKVVNYDGPAEIAAKRISEIIKYPVEASIGYPTPGSFGTYCGVERNIPTITLELDEECPQTALIEPIFDIFDYLLIA